MLRLKRKLGGSMFAPIALVSAMVFIVLYAIFQKNDEARKLASKIGEYIPADIVKPKV